MKIKWSSVKYIGDHDTIGQLTDNRWFWTWNMGSSQEIEALLTTGDMNGENGGKIFKTRTALLEELEEIRPELASLLSKE